MTNIGNLGKKRQQSARLIVVAGISILLAVSFVPSKASSNASCPASKAIFFPNGDDEIVSLQGSNSPATTQSVCSINGVVDVPQFSRKGYTLSRWTGEPDDTSVENIAGLNANSETWTANAALTRAFAQWQPIQYSVSYNYDGGAGAATNTTSNYNSKIYTGATISNETYSFSAPTKNGFRFVGWSLNSNIYAPGAIIDCPDSNVVFTAVWATS